MTETTTTKAFPRLRQASDLRRGGNSVATQATEFGAPLETPELEASTRLDASDVATDAVVLIECDRAAEWQAESADAQLDWEQLAPRGFYSRYGKRVFNLLLLCAVSPFALVLSLPIVLINWIQFGKLAEVLYCQPRVGRRGRIFSIYKFRTMWEAPEDDFDSWSQGQDRLRVTRFGRLLRNTHLDELPQLLNILRGEMDFIGPRPEMVEIDRWACSHVPGFHKRNAILPGITGYAQITQGYAGKDDAAYSKKFAGDELYRRHLSFLLDLVILLRTGVWMLRGRGWRFSPQRRSRSASKRGRKAAGRSTRQDSEQADSLSETSAA